MREAARETATGTTERRPRAAAGEGKVHAIFVTVLIVAIVGLSLWYLTRPEPLLVQGAIDSTRSDIAARVDGRVAKIPVARGENVAAQAPLVEIDNPELVAKYQEAEAAKKVAEAELARIRVGTRQEIVAERKAGIDRAEANVVLAKQTFDRVKRLASDQYAPQAQLDQATDQLSVAQRSYDQAKLAYDEAVNGFTKEEHEIAEANVTKAAATVATLKSLVDQMVVVAPAATQVYRINVEDGEFVAPGVPLLSLVDLDDMWVRFDLREDLIKSLKVGDRIDVRIPALGDRKVTTEVKLIYSKGEYAGWRATRATGDFDLRTFQIRAYPVQKIEGLRPGMSVYAEWPGAG
ncbi:MAG: efflux RND transporter periplasmic adaptor subunit [Alphaproteobacteria bacterium]|nr:efflux RND transporter periplasmic adaptor subunit [Alphaproteobacteria bacterium]